MVERVSTAYAALQRMRVVRRHTKRGVVVVLTLVANWILGISGLGNEFGLYTLLVYALAVYVLLAVVPDSAVRCDLDETTHTHALGSTCALHWAIFVWVAWIVSTFLFYKAEMVFPRSRLLTLLLLVASALTIYDRRAVAPHVFVGLFTLCLAFPGESWMPQTGDPVETVGRVILFFVLVNLLDMYLRTDTVAEADVGDIEDRKQVFCASMEHAASLVSADGNRTRRIIAQSAWVLVTSDRDLVVYGVVLLLVATFTHGETLSRREKALVTPPAPVFEGF